MDRATKLTVVQVGGRLKKLREDRGLSQAELGKLAGYSDYRMISLLENGQRDIRISTLTKLATALGVGPADLIIQLALEKHPLLDDQLLPLFWKCSRLPKQSRTQIARILKGFLGGESA